ncbi:MAG: hypothetical protein K2W85_07075 [Phycisphaerales bacterium]|nr:hypothetical protein [Phycisphaerales bacterium]
MSSFSDRWKTLPRAAKWLVYLGVFAIAWIGLDRFVLVYGDKLSTRADALENALRRERDLSSVDSSDGSLLNASQAVFGRPRLPGEKPLAPETFYRLVDGILQSHGISDSRIEESKVRLSGDNAKALGVGDIDRLILTVTFEADPETVITVLSDLERASEVAAVGKVRIDKAASGRPGDDQRLVRATIMPEAWLVASSGGGS